MRLSKPRILPINQNTATSEQQEVLCELDELRRSFNVYRTLVRHPELAKRFTYATHYLLFESTLPPRDRELMILRIGWLCRSEYEWSRHAILANQAGLSDSEIVRIIEGPAVEGWTPLQRTLLQAVDELHEDAFISDATWNALAREYGEQQLMDLVFTVGEYNLLSMALNSFGRALFLEEILDADDIKVIQETFGYCLQRDYRHQKAIMLLGEGENGKSTLLRALNAFLGKENTSAISLHDLANDRFASSSLYHKLANIYTDISAATLKATGLLKAATGGDQIPAQFKYGHQFFFTNSSKLVFSGNILPRTNDFTPAFYRRWKIITFPHTFPIDDPKRDPQKGEKITTPPELSGILNWALDGLKRLNKQGHFSKDKATDQIERDYTRASNPTKAFADERLRVADATADVSRETVYDAFLKYCQEEKLPVTSFKNFNKYLPYFITTRQTRANEKGERIWKWQGISLNPKEEGEGEKKDPPKPPEEQQKLPVDPPPSGFGPLGHDGQHFSNPRTRVRENREEKGIVEEYEKRGPNGPNGPKIDAVDSRAANCAVCHEAVTPADEENVTIGRIGYVVHHWCLAKFREGYI